MSRYYAIAELPDSRLCAEERVSVVAFGSRAERSAWVEQPEPITRTLRTHGERRRIISRREAAAAMAEVEIAIRGGRPSLAVGYACLRTLGTSSLAELGVSR